MKALVDAETAIGDAETAVDSFLKTTHGQIKFTDAHRNAAAARGQNVDAISGTIALKMREIVHHLKDLVASMPANDPNRAAIESTIDSLS